MTRYIEINSENFETFLKNKGFARGVECSEIVYDRTHDKCNHITIRVLTSIKDKSAIARGVGEDAIRVIAFFNNGKRNFGIAGRQSISRIYRTGSEEKVFERTLERMRQAYSIANDWLKKNPWAKT